MVQREVHYHLQHEPWKGNKCFSKKYQYGIEYILLMKMEYSRKVYQMNNGSKYEKGIEKTITKCIHQHIKNLTVFRLIIYTNEKSHSRYSIPLNAHWNYPWRVDYFFKSVPKIKTTIIYKKARYFHFQGFYHFFYRDDFKNLQEKWAETYFKKLRYQLKPLYCRDYLNSPWWKKIRS